MPMGVHSSLCTVLITALSPCWDHWGCCRKNTVPQRWGWLCTLFSKSGKRRVFCTTAIVHTIGLATKIKQPGCVTHCKANTITNSAVLKSTLSQHLQTFYKTLRRGVDLQGASNKLSVIVASEICLFPLCVKLEGQAHLKLREMKCLHSSLWVLLGTREEILSCDKDDLFMSPYRRKQHMYTLPWSKHVHLWDKLFKKALYTARRMREELNFIQNLSTTGAWCRYWSTKPVLPFSSDGVDHFQSWWNGLCGRQFIQSLLNREYKLL